MKFDPYLTFMWPSFRTSKDISTAATDVFYFPKRNSRFKPGNLVRFSGLFKGQNGNALFDGNRGPDDHYGVAFGRTFKDGFKRIQARNARGENSPTQSISLYFRKVEPFAAVGYGCKHSGERLIRPDQRLVTNPVYTCKASDWNHWTAWSQCSDRCGLGGQKTRQRTCKAAGHCSG